MTSEATTESKRLGKSDKDVFATEAVAVED